jgi:hypothetical protein
MAIPNRISQFYVADSALVQFYAANSAKMSNATKARVQKMIAEQAKIHDRTQPNP